MKSLSVSAGMCFFCIHAAAQTPPGIGHESPRPPVAADGTKTAVPNLQARQQQLLDDVRDLLVQVEILQAGATRWFSSHGIRPKRQTFSKNRRLVETNSQESQAVRIVLTNHS